MATQFLKLSCVLLFICVLHVQSQTCFVPGECQESYHVGGEEATDVYTCGIKCRLFTACNWFTFYNDFSYCQMFNNCTLIDDQACSDCLTGEYNCNGPPAKCYVQGECWGSADHVLETQSKEECLISCKDTKGCRWFTFHNPTSACVLYKTCDEIYSCTDCVSGEVRCSAPTTTTTTEQTSTTEQMSTTTKPVLPVYLVGGSDDSEGNVFAINPDTGVNGPVCDDGWDLDNAKVVCKQLGFSDASEATIESSFGQVETNYSYDNVACNGNEQALDDCQHDDNHNCSDMEAAGVICIT